MGEIIQKLGPWAFIDIIIIAVLVYNMLLLIRGTRAMQMVLGLMMMSAFAFVLSQFYPLSTLKWLMDKFYSSILIILVILFQEDIRRVLSRMGKKTVFPTGDNISSQQLLDEVNRAVTSLANKKIGALIVLERNILLNRYVDVGVLIDARISKELLVSIFYPESPIHDGAVIIQQGRIAAAGCFLPLTRDENVDPDLGTRHRAAIGISQETDAIVLVVSEERKAISLVIDGNVSRDLGAKELRKVLRNLLASEEDVSNLPTTKPAYMNMVEKMKIFRSGGDKSEILDLELIIS